MPRAGLAQRIRLRGTSDGNDVGLNLHRNEDGSFAYSWTLAPPLAPDVEDKDVNYGQFSPDQELTWAQSDWSGGAFKFYSTKEIPNGYAFVDRVWALTPNELSRAMKMEQVTFGVKYGGFQSLTGWTDSGLTSLLETEQSAYSSVNRQAHGGGTYNVVGPFSNADTLTHALTILPISEKDGDWITLSKDSQKAPLYL